jgi:CspA family cold shock protein
MIGTVAWFNDSKGYGFLATEGEDRHIFVHYTEILCEGFQTLEKGATVEFELIEGEKGPKAGSVITIVTAGGERIPVHQLMNARKKSLLRAKKREWEKTPIGRVSKALTITFGLGCVAGLLVLIFRAVL